MEWQVQLALLGKILLSAFLGGLGGLERQVADKPAGLRTHMLVSASATLVVILGNWVVASFNASENVQSDPIRIIEAVIVGISFLGAGTIIRNQEGQRVEGLTTAASILFTSGIGIAIAIDQYVLAIGSSLLMLFINRVLLIVVQRLNI